MQKDYIGTLYTGVSDAFQAGLYPIARCLKAENHDLSVVEIIKLTERVDMRNDFGKIAKQTSKQAKQRRMPPRESEWGNWWKLCRSGVRQRLFVSYTYGYARWRQTTAYSGG